MSLRLEMLQVARLAPKILDESTELVSSFLKSQQNPDGGFKDRTGRSDLYYTVFGLDGLLALQVTLEVAPVAAYLRQFGSGGGLDFVHLCCLARCWAAARDLERGSGTWPTTISEFCPPEIRKSLLDKVEQFRSGDGGYHPTRGSTYGTAYGCFLALAAYQDLGGELPDPLSLMKCLQSLAIRDTSWSNDRNTQAGSTNATAAAVAVLRQLGYPVPKGVGYWLLGLCNHQGGFLAVPGAPIPDLLSTATALHALGGLQISLAPVKEACLDFVDSLWTNAGGFHGHWADDQLDCEYTYYGLLALGHLESV